MCFFQASWRHNGLSGKRYNDHGWSALGGSSLKHALNILYRTIGIVTPSLKMASSIPKYSKNDSILTTFLYIIIFYLFTFILFTLFPQYFQLVLAPTFPSIISSPAECMKTMWTDRPKTPRSQWEHRALKRQWSPLRGRSYYLGTKFLPR